MKNKQDDAFLNFIKNVSPIKKNNRIEKTIPKNINKKTLKQNINNFETKKNIEKLQKKNNPINFKIEKNMTNKKLKKGLIPIDKKIDFHGLSLIDAEQLFVQTIQSCFKKNQRCILFVTGKGILKKNKNTSDIKLYYGKIRSNFIDWTKKKELNRFILNVEQASIEHGADGAFFVYLRKLKSKFI